MKNVNLIKTPDLKLAIGEPVLLEDGTMGLKIKGKGQIYDTISLDILQESVKCCLRPKLKNCN